MGAKTRSSTHLGFGLDLESMSLELTLVHYSFTNSFYCFSGWDLFLLGCFRIGKRSRAEGELRIWIWSRNTEQHFYMYM